MTKQLRLIGLLLLGFAFASCEDNPEAAKPVYLKLDAISLQTDYDLEGTAHSNITTAWIFINEQILGAYELPCIVPAILPEGKVDFVIFPGINTNGISSVRAINDVLAPIRLTKTKPNSVNNLDTIEFTAQELTISYFERAEIEIVEDFDQSGSNLSPSVFSDTNFVKIDTQDSVFTFTPPLSTTPEKNGRAGLLSLTDKNDLAEIVSVNSYQIPAGTQNLYLEVTYRNNIQVSFGLQAEFNGRSERGLTATVLPKKEWSKIYINLSTELQAFPGANGYKLLIFARKPDNVAEGRIFLDNLKLVYIP
jgi:hypothetical protein